jgi:NNP family nitrate/nitrite transporter-like MFS transporter
MGATYDAQDNSYFVGLSLLAVFALASFLLALTIHNGQKTDDR